MPTPQPQLNDSLRALKLRWDDYRSRSGFDQFAEFTALLAAKRLGRTRVER